MVILDWVTGLIFVVFSGLTVFYWLRVVRFPTSYTREFFIALIIQNFAVYLAFLHFTNLTKSGYIAVWANILTIITLYLIFDYHDSMNVYEPRGHLKLLFLFLCTLLIGVLFANIMNEPPYIASNTFSILVTMAIFGFVAYGRAFYYIFTETGYLEEMPPKSLSSFRTGVLLIFVVFLFFFSLAILSPDFYESFPLVGYILSVVFTSTLIIVYSVDPTRELSFPQGILWLGVIDDNGELLYARMVSNSPDHSKILDDINTKLKNSYNPLNFLISEALNANLEIKRLYGSKFSIFSERIHNGRIICLIEELKKRVANYSYSNLIKLIATHEKSPFSEVANLKEDPEEASKFLDQLMIPVVR